MENKFYVYLHIKETTGEPFYVGKGCGYRSTRKTNRTKHWHSIVNKYGYDVINLEVNLTEEESFEKEIYWIDRIGRKDLGNGPLINYSNGGEGTSGYKMSDERKQLTSERFKGRISPMKGKDPWNKGKKGVQIMSEETRKKISESHTNKESKNGKLILNLETGIFYNSILDASKTSKISKTTLSEYLSGKYKNKTSFIFA